MRARRGRRGADGGRRRVHGHRLVRRVLLPHEADDPTTRCSSRTSACTPPRRALRRRREQARDVLMRSMHASEPSLHEHSRDVAELAGADRSPARDGRRGGRRGHPRGGAARPRQGRRAGRDPREARGARRRGVGVHAPAHDPRRADPQRRPALRPVARIVRATHERWDGGGYPDGLAGEQIPLSARVVAVCDAYEAMITDRAYRPRARPRRGLPRAAPRGGRASSTPPSWRPSCSRSTAPRAARTARRGDVRRRPRAQRGHRAPAGAAEAAAGHGPSTTPFQAGTTASG